MKTPTPPCKKAFTLLETVIAIGVLAVLLTGFIIVFAPAAAGIKKAINIQQANRLTSALEQELVTSRGNDPTPGFNKAFAWLKDNTTSAENSIFVYQYRGDPNSTRSDGTPAPLQDISSKLPGKAYLLRSMARRKSDPLFLEDLPAIQGGVYLVKCTQLVFDSSGKLTAGTAGQIKNPKPANSSDPNYSAGPFDKSDDYPEAVIAFTADFYALPARSSGFFTGGFQKFLTDKVNPNKVKPIFTRNLAVRR